VVLAKTVAPKSSSHLAEIITFKRKKTKKQKIAYRKIILLPKAITDTSLTAD